MIKPQPYPARSLAETALSVLIIMQIIMLTALFTQTPPHPPLSVPLFGLGPFLGAAIAVAAAAIMLGAERTRLGKSLSATAALLALVSYGPHKWIDPAIAQIWPAVLVSEVAVAAIAWACLRPNRPAPAAAS